MRRPATASTTSCPTRRTRGWPPRPRRPGRGGRTGPRGSESVPARSVEHRRSSEGRGIARSRRRPGRTSASEMPHASVNGTRLYFEREGTGPPLLLITGFTISAAVFEPVLDRYARRFECILYDNRAAGRSAVPLRPTSMPELAADAAGMLDALGLESAHVY